MYRNVLTFIFEACTVAALAFGPIHNITTKSLGVVSPGDVEPGLLTKVFLKLKKLLRLDKKKSSEEKHDEIKDDCTKVLKIIYFCIDI